MQTIFISLASYREPELRSTIDSALKQAEYPERIHFGVYSQVEDGEHPDLSDIPNLVEVVVPASTAKGPSFARSEVMKMFAGQDYFLQIDAHSVFIPKWDTRLVNLHSKVRSETGNQKVILSHWATPYMLDENNIPVLGKHERIEWYPRSAHYCKLGESSGYWIGYRYPFTAKAEYQETHTALGGLIFATGNLVEEVPYDFGLSWSGEELGYSVRAYCAGWNIYSPRGIYLFHNYERHGNPRPWDSSPEWFELQKESKRRLYMMLTLQLKDEFALASESRYQEYMSLVGIDLMNESKKLLTKLDSSTYNSAYF